MNLKVLPFAAAMMLPAIAPVLTTLVVKKVQAKKQSQPVWIGMPLNREDRRVLSAAGLL